jgi:hypothetical protein
LCGFVRELSTNARLRRFVSMLPAALAACVACHGEHTPAPKAHVPALKRGDLVVVERAAAEFFEARVLSVTNDSLKVQTSTEGDPVVVAASDAYLVQVEPHRFASGDAAICRSAAARWEACRVLTPGSTANDVELANGERRALGADALLVPGSVTVLDIHRHFELLRARRDFASTAHAAGQPRRPSGWTPAPHEPVLARKGNDWYLAHAAQLLPDGGESVMWEGSSATEPLPGNYVVPAPPFEHTFARGDFALMRPATPGGGWERVAIEAVGADGALVVGAGGERRHVEARTLVPLANPR